MLSKAINGLSFAIYSAVSLLFFGRVTDWSRSYIGVGPDPMTYIWALNRWPWAIHRGFDPLVSHFVWYPAGFHMAWADMTPKNAGPRCAAVHRVARRDELRRHLGRRAKRGIVEGSEVFVDRAASRIRWQAGMT